MTHYEPLPDNEVEEIEASYRAHNWLENNAPDYVNKHLDDRVQRLLAETAALRQQLEEARGVVKPFAAYAAIMTDRHDDRVLCGGYMEMPTIKITVGDIRAAAAWLAGEE